MGTVCTLRDRGHQPQELTWTQSFSSWFAPSNPDRRQVLGKYLMHMGDLGVIGEGSNSICRKGTVMATRQTVAIKVYKPKAGNAEVQLQKFRRQISVLQMLQSPFEPPADASLWCKDLERTMPSRVFMQLIDYSKDSSGRPGPDPKDGQMYVVTELASYSLKDFLKMRKEQQKPLSPETIRSLTRAIILVTAGLHAKGLVHLDLKPENLMIFSGTLKLIDVDGCVRIGTRIRISDSSLSFSPCYCAPEWAAFVIEDSDDPRIIAAPGLDVWSIGISICEFVTLNPVLKHTYASFMRHGRSQREAGFLFMEWLSSVKKAPLPSTIVKQGDPDLVDLLTGWLLVPSKGKRQSLAASLSHNFVRHADWRKSETGPLTMSGDVKPNEDYLPLDTPVNKAGPPARRRSEDHSSKVMHKGTLWKLNVGSDPKDPTQWLRRDMWIAANGSLCYFSLKEDKRLVLIDSHLFSTSVLTKYPDAVRQPAFMIQTRPEYEEQEEGNDEHIFACESEEDYTAWVLAYETLKTDIMRSVKLGPKMAQDLHKFRLSVNNRRKKVGLRSKELTPTLKSRLWKCKANGDAGKADHWFEREMWLSENGCLVYFSPKEERELVYYTDTDLASCSLAIVPGGEAARPWAFQVLLASSGDLEFAPGIFAADSEASRRRWMEEIRSLAARKSSF
mmetsp:Transcript_43585/g.136911  ORF Transcript_43585/g.136911 Transcript_43585/m.136911 type:complete len:673 (-) Transcript_43585:61-2079(-)